MMNKNMKNMKEKKTAGMIKGMMAGMMAGAVCVSAAAAPCMAEEKVTIESEAVADTDEAGAGAEAYEAFLKELESTFEGMADEDPEGDGFAPETVVTVVKDKVVSLDEEELTGLITALADPEVRTDFVRQFVSYTDMDEEMKNQLVQLVEDFSLDDALTKAGEAVTEIGNELRNPEFWKALGEAVVMAASEAIDEQLEVIGNELINVEAEDIAALVNNLFS